MNLDLIRRFVSETSFAAATVTAVQRRLVHACDDVAACLLVIYNGMNVSADSLWFEAKNQRPSSGSSLVGSLVSSPPTLPSPLRVGGSLPNAVVGSR